MASGPSGLFWKALFAFLALPGIVAFVVPLAIAWPDDGQRFASAGLLPLIAGIALLLWCVVCFYRAGRGTLAPWSPPRALVTIGPYRFSRNPMYVAVALILAGWALTLRSQALLLYLALVVLAFHLRVTQGEEPWLARTHGRAWDEYAARVRRWL